MATFDHRMRAVVSAVAVAGLLGGAIAVSGVARSASGSRVVDDGTRTSGVHVPASFSWLRRARAPKTWTPATLASGGATLFYPSNWRPIPGDRGTVTAALRDPQGLYLGYLNVTPREGTERLAGWAAFRIRRNTEEGDPRTHLVAAAEDLRVGGTRWSCVIDDYLSRIGSHPYREVACIAAGSRFENVFVGATLVRDWATLGPVIEHAASTLIER